MIEDRLTEALTFDDVLLVPQRSDVLPVAGRRDDTPHEDDRPEDPDRVRRDGHGDRGAPRDRPRPGGRARLHPQEHDDRGAGRRGRQGQALGVGDDRRPGHRRAGRAGRRGARADEEVPDQRRARDGRHEAGRHPHQPRPALRDADDAARLGADDQGAPDHGPGGHDARRGQGDAPQAQGGEAAGRRPRLQPEGPDHRQGHPEADQVPERLQGLAGPAARRRRRGRRGRHARARRRAGRGQGGRRGGRHRARPQQGRARDRREGQGRAPRPRADRRQRRHLRRARRT